MKWQGVGGLRGGSGGFSRRGKIRSEPRFLGAHESQVVLKLGHPDSRSGMSLRNPTT